MSDAKRGISDFGSNAMEVVKSFKSEVMRLLALIVVMPFLFLGTVWTMTTFGDNAKLIGRIGAQTLSILWFALAFHIIGVSSILIVINQRFHLEERRNDERADSIRRGIRRVRYLLFRVIVDMELKNHKSTIDNTHLRAYYGWVKEGYHELHGVERILNKKNR